MILSNIILTWGGFIRRSSSIANLCKIEDIHIKPIFESKSLKALNYSIMLIKSFYIIFFGRHDVITLCAPPTLALYFLFIRKFFFGRAYNVDCHNGVFSKFWVKTPLLELMLRNADNVFIHNENLLGFLKEKNLLGIKNFDNLKVVLDPPSSAIFKDLQDGVLNEGKIFILFPFSYSSDEPIDEAIKLAERLESNSELTFVFSGPSGKMTAENLNRIKVLSNVIRTGFLSIEKYEELLLKTSIAFCLTTEENIQLCSVNEAIGFGIIPIFSKTDTLMKLYSGVGVHTKNNNADMLLALEYALINKLKLKSEVMDAALKRRGDWLKEYSEFF